MNKNKKNPTEIKLEASQAAAAAVVCEQNCGGESDQLTHDSDKLELKAVTCPDKRLLRRRRS